MSDRLPDNTEAEPKIIIQSRPIILYGQEVDAHYNRSEQTITVNRNAHLADLIQHAYSFGKFDGLELGEQ